LALLGALSLAVAGPAAADASFVPGTGTSSSGVARLQLRSSGAAIGFGLGVVRTRFAGAQGNAEAASVDLGLFDTLAKAPLACGYSFDRIVPPGFVPAQAVVSSGDGATEKRTASAGQGGPLQFGSQYAAAAPDASAAAMVEATNLNLPGLLEVLGGTATSTAKLVPGSQRQSAAEATLSGLNLAGGLVKLAGLHWTASNGSGARNENTAGFSVGGINVGGTELPTGDADQLRQALAAANSALAATGLSLVAPAVTRTPGGSEVTPLRISVSATPTLRAALDPALAGIQPVRSQLLALVTPVQASPDCGLAKAVGFSYLAADLATLVLGEGGALDVDLGGARAGTDGTAYANPFASGYGLIPPAVTLPPLIPAVPAPVAPVLSGPPPVSVAAPDPVAVSTLAAAGVARPVAMAVASVSCRSTNANGGGCASGHGRLAAWLALALIVALAAADRVRALLA
jgi:hypothetical protein